MKEPGSDAVDIQEHPHDPKRAVILGVGNTHWATKDRGETWQEFKTKYPTSSAQAPLAFHAENPDYVLYAGRNCEEEDFWELCEDNVSRNLGSPLAVGYSSNLFRHTTRRIGSKTLSYSKNSPALASLLGVRNF